MTTATMEEKMELEADLQNFEKKIRGIEQRVEQRVEAHPAIRYELDLRDIDQEELGRVKLKASDARVRLRQQADAKNANTVKEADVEITKCLDRMSAAGVELRAHGREAVEALTKLMLSLGELAKPSNEIVRARNQLNEFRMRRLRAGGSEERLDVPEIPILMEEVQRLLTNELAKASTRRTPEEYLRQFPGLELFSDGNEEE
jgi:hypothetical protein